MRKDELVILSAITCHLPTCVYHTTHFGPFIASNYRGRKREEKKVEREREREREEQREIKSERGK